MAADEPNGPVPPPQPVPPAPRPRKGRRVLLILVLALAGVLVVGAGTAFVIYDKATAIDRSTPEVVVGQFLRASLVERDLAKLSLFVCDQWSAQSAMEVVAPPPDNRVVISWGDYASNIAGRKATVDVKVEFNRGTGSVSASSVRSWKLMLEDQSGWRVCSLTKAESLNP